MDYKILVLSYMCVFMTSFLCGSKSVNYSTAVDKCKDRNGLASYQHFMNSSRRSWDGNKSLRKEQSLWISGKVSFSDEFVRYIGCYEKAKNDVRIYNVSNNDIYKCLKNCSGANTSFIGVEDNLCNCISEKNLNESTLTNDTECRQRHFIPIVGPQESLMKKKMDVYEIISNSQLNWNSSNNKNIGQCVYYHEDGKEVGYFTGSCNSKETGFICTSEDVGKVFNANCRSYDLIHNNALKFCNYSQPSMLASPFTDCRQYPSIFQGLSYADVKRELRKMNRNVSLWTGVYRSFIISQFRDMDVLRENSVCLSVVNVNNTLVFDPVKCSSEKEYICEDDVSNNEEQTLYKTTIFTDKTPFLTSKNTNINIHSTPNPEISDYRDYMVTIIISTIVFSLLITICILFRKKIKKLVCTYEEDTKSKHIQEKDSANTGVRLGSADNISLAHSNKSTNPEADYALASDDVPMSEAVESEYDRVNTSVCRKQVRDIVAFENDANAYGVHTGIIQEHDNDDYDHLEAHTSKHMKASADGIYNTMTEDNDTYNELKLKNSVNIEKPSKCIEKSDTTYDKLD